MSNKKILITGASGFLGYHLLRIATGLGYEVFGLYHNGAVLFDKSINLQVDLRNYIDMGNIIDDIEPDVVIHAAALADANLCQTNRELSHQINVEATANIAGICCDYQVPFAFTSTDMVFDGTKGNYSEEDEPNPLMVYGEHKLEAEQEVTRIYPQALIARCPLMFGSLEASSKNYFANFIKALQAGSKANLFTDEYRSICGAVSVAKGILHLCEEVSGIVHVAGAERVSRYEFGQGVAAVFGFDRSLLNAMSQKEVQMAAPRPADVSLNISKAVSLGYDPTLYKDELRLIASGIYL